MKRILISILIGFTILSCSSDDDDDNQSSCDFETVLSTEQFENAPSDGLTINSVEINNNCVEINFSSGGCDGESWELALISSEEVFESNPPGRSIRLSLQNEELCQAFITQELTFDISNLQVDGNQLLLNIANFDETVLYEY